MDGLADLKLLKW